MNINLAPLTPQFHDLSNGHQIAIFFSNTLDLVKIDFTYEAGTCYQHHNLVAHATCQLLGEASLHTSADQVAEFLDFRGIVIERSVDTVSGCVSVYLLRKYAEEFFPLLRELLLEPLFSEAELELYRHKRRQQILQSQQKTAWVARNLFYEALFGIDHPYGGHAVPEDADRLTVEEIQQFFNDHYSFSHAHITLSGHVDDQLIDLFDQTFGCLSYSSERIVPYVPGLTQPWHHQPVIRQSVSGTVQCTLRVGRVLPMHWSSNDYSDFMVLSTVLGGYFGSRLMSNIREDKGYTYGIYSQTQIFRGHIVFFITADVGAEVAADALCEVHHEIKRLQQELIPDEELSLVRNFLEGDFVRGIDGIFELSERYRMMYTTQVSEDFTRNHLNSIRTVTAKRLQQLAQQYLQLDDLVQVIAG